MNWSWKAKQSKIILKRKVRRIRERKMSMRGIGGPLLCIGDLLNDVGEEEQQHGQGHSLLRETFPSSSNFNYNDPPPDLTKLFQVPFLFIPHSFISFEFVSRVKTAILCVVSGTLRPLEFRTLWHRPLLDLSHLEGIIIMLCTLNLLL